MTNPNCAAMPLAIVLASLRTYQPKRVLITTLQGLSGAGYPGVASLDATANVIPFIDGEEQKIETETRKILGRLVADSVELHPVTVSATSTRVPVINGHTESVSVEFEKNVTHEEILGGVSRFFRRAAEIGIAERAAAADCLSRRAESSAAAVGCGARRRNGDARGPFAGLPGAGPQIRAAEP